MKNVTLSILGMSCTGCEKIIENNLNKINGVYVKANYPKSKVSIEYEEDIITLEEIIKRLNKLGYKIKGNKRKSLETDDYITIVLLAIIGNYIISYLVGINIISSIISTINMLIFNVPVISENASLFVIFLIGVLTSFHCVAMCGGINVAQCLSFENSSKLSNNIQYNIGRVISYTIIGGIVGLIGSIFSISPNLQGYLYIVIGFFMVMMGLNIMGVPFVKILVPRLPRKLHKISKSNKGSFVVGILNGFMPCGPLQSMQIYALSTGSFIGGALSMFAFSIGTVPLMYLFGKIGDLKNKDFMNKFIKISALLVLFLGFTMSIRGLAILGVDYNTDYSNNVTEISGNIEEDIQVIYMDLKPRSYDKIVVKKDIPVKLIINAKQENLNGCNNEIIINEYNIQKKLNIGENIIEFLPTEVGQFRYSCWMGMIRSTITVIE